MASLSLSTLPSITTTKKNPLFFKTSSHANQSHRFKVSCNSTPNNNDKTAKTSETPKLILPKTPPFEMQNVDRRNLLVGIGGLYGAASLTSIPSAFGVPIAAPDNIADCKAATTNLVNANDTVRGLACCPPVLSTAKPKPYILPTNPVVRMRPAAQRASPEYIAKYKAAIQAMKDLPDEHPHSWKQQAKIHCAYCNGGYTQVQSGHPEKRLQIHNSWLFFPFHRWYLYFFERILGKLIKDPTFAIPYWNWDHPTGMMIPAMFEADGKQSSIFDPYRDVTHLPPSIFDADYDGKEKGVSSLDQININKACMYKQMLSSASNTTAFFGGEYVSGGDDANNVAGSIETGVHTAAHRWVGNPRMANNEDMGNFYSAGYDPIFYAHHANVDRMWKIWKVLNVNQHKDPVSPDWLNASYVFYNENEELVRVYNRDCIDYRRMGFDWDRTELLWLQSRPIPHAKGRRVATRSLGIVKKSEDVKFPIKLNQTVKVLVKRPTKKRSKAEKQTANEMLYLRGIKFDGDEFVKFDVFVNDVDDGIVTTAAESEHAGSFSQLQHGHKHGDKRPMTSGAMFGLTELLEDIEAEDDDSVLVTLVPKAGCDELTIDEIVIKIVPIV